MTRLDDVGEADGWRCWLCDEAVDPDMSVNDDRGPSIDSMTTRSKPKQKGHGIVVRQRKARSSRMQHQEGGRCSNSAVAQ